MYFDPDSSNKTEYNFNLYYELARSPIVNNYCFSTQMIIALMNLNTTESRLQVMNELPSFQDNKFQLQIYLSEKFINSVMKSLH